MSDLILTVKNLCKSYFLQKKEIKILKSLSFSIHHGEFAAIMGPSGSGKSTLLHLIAGLTSTTSGDLFFHGKKITTFNDQQWTALRRKKIGFIFQSFNLLPSMTIKNNITLPLEADGQKITTAELQSLAKKLGIADYLQRLPSRLSGGEQQRAAIARALLPHPDLIMADEPTGSLDTENGQDLCQLLQQFVREEQRTILMVTHEPAVAYWADRILVMKDGQFIGELFPPKLKNAQELAIAYQKMQQQNNQS
ncbi:MAG: ABC transporter ATP-binding protein [Lentisphaeria bacterium]